MSIRDIDREPVMTTRRVLLLATPALILTPAVAFAHHGWGSFDRNRVLDHTGAVTRSSFANPHGVVISPREGRELTFELAPVGRMQARGLSADDIAPGRTVRLFGYQNTQTATLYRAEWIEVGGRRIELR
jgi:hypothetical protein